MLPFLQFHHLILLSFCQGGDGDTSSKGIVGVCSEPKALLVVVRWVLCPVIFCALNKNIFCLLCFDTSQYVYISWSIAQKYSQQ